MFGHDGCGFGVKLIDGRPVRNHEPDRNIPVLRVVGGCVVPDFVVADQAFLFQRLVGRFDVLAKILPECLSLPGRARPVQDRSSDSAKRRGARLTELRPIEWPIELFSCCLQLILGRTDVAQLGTPKRITGDNRFQGFRKLKANGCPAEIFLYRLRLGLSNYCGQSGDIRLLHGL